MNKIIGILLVLCIVGAAQAQTCGLAEISENYSYQYLDINDAGVIVNSGVGDDGYDGAVYFGRPGGETIRLPDLGGDHVHASAINNHNKVAGYAEDPDGTEYPVTWASGVLAKLPLLPRSPPGRGGRANGLNDARAVVGYSIASNGHNHAVLWVDGKSNDLNRILGSVSSEAYAINNKGQIIGSAYFDEYRYEAFLYQGGTVQFLGTIDGNPVFPNAINDDGQIVGSSGNQYREKNRAFLWQNGAFTDLGTLGGDSSIAYDINIHGQVVGQSKGRNGQWIAFSWKDGVMTRIGTLTNLRYGEKSFKSNASAVNANGRVVGYSRWTFRDTYTLSTSWHWKKRC